MTGHAEKKTLVRAAQTALVAEGFKPGPADGLLGGDTSREIALALASKPDSPVRWSRWPAYRQLIGYLQMKMKEAGVDVGLIDGFVGPQTRYAFEQYQHILQHGRAPVSWRDEDNDQTDPNAEIVDWPRYNQLVNFYGKPGTNHATIQLPYTMRIAWNLKQRINAFTIHERLVDPVGRVLDRALDHYGVEGLRDIGADLFGGCYNNRPMRGGRKLSTHAFAAAIDFDPTRNQLRWGRDRARLALPDCVMWWRLWEQEGFTSLGRAKNYDWMHVQGVDV